jgi:hypothetical protein
LLALALAISAGVGLTAPNLAGAAMAAGGRAIALVAEALDRRRAPDPVPVSV